MIELQIDDHLVQVPEGSMVIQAAQQAGTYIPHFCYHKKLSIAANCRMCLVDIEKAPKAMPACATPVASGMVVRTKSEKAVSAQQSVMEFLLINHPLDCPICDQGGECQLQDLAVGYGQSHSRYSEEKRIVLHKYAGPLVAMEEMTRCIHCTRCVRFGQEVAGIMELGMLGRGEHAEITSFVGQSVDSELSGNMIDLCPVGALTSKPFRYTARGWELSRRPSISPHDSVGSNLIVQVKNNRVMRVLPLENEAINECWLSDKDRFSYEALNSEQRLTQPMLKQADGQWQAVDWSNALQTVVDSLNQIKQAHGAQAINILASPQCTLEELYLLKQLAIGIGTPNIDFRLRQTDFRAPLSGVRWLGMPITELSRLDAALVIGSFLNRDHPLLATRLRQAAKNGAKIHYLNAMNDNALIATAHSIVAAPSEWLNELARIAVAIAHLKRISTPAVFASVTPSDAAHNIAASLISGEHCAVLLGNIAVSHPDFSLIHASVQWIADYTGASLGFLTEAANTVGAQLVRTLPDQGGLNALDMFKNSKPKPYGAYLLFNVEPEYDAANPAQALTALAQAEKVISFSTFKHHTDYADSLLPMAPFTETAGSFVNAAGVLQSFNNVVRPLADARPGWKILQALGRLFNLPGFAYDTVEAVRAAALNGIGIDIAARLSNETKMPLSLSATVQSPSYNEPPDHPDHSNHHHPLFERLADVPIYHADPLVRRAKSLHLTQAAKAAMTLSLPPGCFKALGLKDGEKVQVSQRERSVTMPAVCDARLSEAVVRVPAATPASAQLAGMFDELKVARVD